MKYLLALGLVGLFFRFAGPKRKRSGATTSASRHMGWRRFVPHIGQVSAIMLAVLWLIAMGFLLFVV